MTTNFDPYPTDGVQIGRLAELEIAAATRLEITGFVAALLLLRWCEKEDIDRAAEAAREQRPYEPVIPRDLTWSVWSSERAPVRNRFLNEKLLPWLSRPDYDPPWLRDEIAPIAERLYRLEPVLSELPKVKDDTISEAIFDLLRPIKLGDPAGRRQAQAVLEKLVTWTAATQKHGLQSYTPGAIVELMLDLADPKPGEQVYDPCFGLGGLLAASARRISASAERLPPADWQKLQLNSIFGVEIQPVPYLIGLARVVLAGISEHAMELGDALARPTTGLFAERFDVVLANPPWARLPVDRVTTRSATFSGESRRVREFKHDDRYDHFPVRSRTLEGVFLQHAVGSLRPGGRAVVAVPEGVLFRESEAPLRQWLLRDFRVEGVVSLPAGTFSPYTGIKANLLLVRHEPVGPSVRFVTVNHLVSLEGRPRGDGESARAVAERFREGRPGPQLWEVHLEDIARRGHSLIATQGLAAALEELFERIQQADAGISLSQLGDVASFTTGFHVRPESTSKVRPVGRPYLSVVRGSDIRDGKIRPASLFLIEDLPKSATLARLRSDDIVIPRIGTTWHAAVVPQKELHVAASSVLVIRPSSVVSSEFLVTLMRSEHYQTWLTANALLLSSAQQISPAILRRLPVPLPPRMLQDQVVRECQAEGADPLNVLLRIISGRTSTLLRVALLPVVRAFRKMKFQQIKGYEPDGSAEQLLLLDQIGSAAKETQNHFIQSSPPGPSGQFDPRLTAFCHAAAVLRGISRIPPGLTRYAILETARAALEQSLNTQDTTSDTIDRAGGRIVRSTFEAGAAEAFMMTRRVAEVVLAQAEAALQTVQVDAILDTAQVAAGGQEVIARLINRSRLPLRNLSVSVHPFGGGAEATLLTEGQALPVPVATGDLSPGTLSFRLAWRGERLDGFPISGQVTLSLKVVPVMCPEKNEDLGTSPYVVGPPVESKELFLGRGGLIDQIRRQLPIDHRANVILLEGNRRAGKTSILKHLKLPGVLPGWHPVYCSFQEGEGVAGRAGLPTAEVFRLMARNIGWQLDSVGVRTWFPDTPLPDHGQLFKTQFSDAAKKVFTTDRPVEAFRLYLERAIEACEPNRLLLMLDEFDKLQEGIDSGITSPQVPENIRNLLHDYPQFSAILSGSRRLKRLRNEYWSALFGFGQRVGVSAISPEDARTLVTRPIEGRLTYIDEARDRVVELCVRQPFLIQSLCNRVFEMAADGRNQIITVSAVEQAAVSLVQDNEHFQTLWEYAATERRRLLMALCVELASGPDPITYSLFEAKLEEFLVPIPPDEPLADDIDFLRELEFIELDPASGGAVYRLAVPLMAEWIRRNVDTVALRTKARREGEEKLA